MVASLSQISHQVSVERIRHTGMVWRVGCMQEKIYKQLHVCCSNLHPISAELAVVYVMQCVGNEQNA